MAVKIMIIDDDVDTLKLVGLMLQKQGYQIVAATNGQQGLSQIEVENPDLILLDVMMPEMDGWEVCKVIRDVYQDSIKILMLTAKDTVRDRIIGKNILKADEYMTKPFDIDALLTSVAHLLAKESS